MLQVAIKGSGRLKSDEGEGVLSRQGRFIISRAYSQSSPLSRPLALWKFQPAFSISSPPSDWPCDTPFMLLTNPHFKYVFKELERVNSISVITSTELEHDVGWLLWKLSPLPPNSDISSLSYFQVCLPGEVLLQYLIIEILEYSRFRELANLPSCTISKFNAVAEATTYWLFISRN